MEFAAKILGLITAICCLGAPALSKADDQDQGFIRVVYCQNEAGRAEIYLPGRWVAGIGKAEFDLRDRGTSGYLTFDFTPVGKNKTMEAVQIRTGNNGAALLVELSERNLRAIIPLAGGKVNFPQRLAEEMTCKAFNKY